MKTLHMRVNQSLLVAAALLGLSSVTEAARPELVLQTGHAGTITAVGLSPNGKLAFTGASDKTAIGWDTRTGNKVRTYQGHNDVITSLAVSCDGKQLLTGSLDNTAILWDVETGQALRTFKNFKERISQFGIWGVALSPDGKRALTGSSDKTAILWDVPTGQPLRVLAQGDWVFAVAFNANGTQALVGTDKPAAVLYDVRSGNRLQTFKGHTQNVQAVALSPDGSQVATGSLDKTVMLFDAATGQPQRTLKDHTAGVLTVKFSPDGKRLVSGSSDATAILWDLATGKSLRVLGGHNAPVQGAVFSADGKWLLTGSTDRTAILWDAATGNKIQTLRGHVRDVRGVGFSPDGHHMLTASVDGTASLWDARAGECQRLFRGHTDPILAAVFSADGHSVLTGAMDQTAILWDADTGEKRQVFKGHTDSLRAVALSPDGRRALTGAEDQTAILWDVATGKALFTLKGHSGKVRAVAFSPNGKFLATGAEADPKALGKVQEARAILWDASTGQEVREFTGHQASVTSVAFSPDGSLLATGSGDQTAALWEVATGRRQRVLEGHKRVLTSVAFSSDGKHLVTGSQDRTAMLWDVRTGNQLRTFEGHAGSVWSVALSTDNRRLLTGSADGTARLWDTAKAEEQIQLINMDAGKDWMAVTPAGLYDGSMDGWQKVAYRMGDGMNVVPVDRFSQDFFKPGLLATVWGGKQPVPDVEMGKSRAPLVRIVAPKEGGVVEANEVALEVEASDQGGGVRGPWLMQNGVRVSTSNPVQKQGKTSQRRFDVALVEGENRLEVEAASDDGSMTSEPAVLVLRYEKPLPKPQLYLVAVGVSSYAQGAYKLKFARADAEAMADLFRRRGEVLYEKPLHIVEVLDDQATKEGIRKALAEAVGQARPQDTLVLFMAGHGTMAGARYYFIPHEFRSHPEKSLDDDVREQGLAAEVLGDFLSQGKALKRILILDTCASGGAVDLFRGATRNPFGFRGDVERLSRSQGHFILAAAAATEEAKEPEKLNHGALSYALLAGMRAVKEGPLQGKGLEPSGGGRVAGVLEWFTYAAGQVPRLTKEFCGEEQNVNVGSRGATFPVLPVEEK